MTTREKLSPEEVAAMSDEELSLAVARAVYGAVPADHPAPLGPDDYFFRSEREGLRLFVTEDDFHASPARGVYILLSPSNPVAVEYVREHMRERWEMEGRFGNWRLEYIPQNGLWWASLAESKTWGGPVENERFVASAKILGRAVFESAVLAAQEMQG